MNKFKILFRVALSMTVIFLLFLSANQSVSNESASYKSKNNFSFFKVTEKDDLNSSWEKFRKADCACAKGKSTSLDTGYQKKHIKTKDIPEKIKKVFSADQKLDAWAKDTKFKSMPIETIHCEASKNLSFNYWIGYFSVSTKKLLSITISCNDYKPVKKRLIERYGRCIENNYCEKNGNSLLIVKHENEYLINMFFINNIKSHYSENKKQFLKRKKKSDKIIKDAF